MASDHFRNRFKDKFVMMSARGIAGTELSQQVTKLNQPMTVMQFSGSRILKTKADSPSFSRPLRLTSLKQNFDTPSVGSSVVQPRSELFQSTQKKTRPISLPVASVKSSAIKTIENSYFPENKECSSSMTGLMSQKPRFTYFKPYSLTDYRSKKFDQYYVLGGLGSYNIGTEEWKMKKDYLDKRNQYAKIANRINMVRSKVRKSGSETEVMKTARQRSLEFAQKIRKPKVKVFSTRMEREEVDELELLNAKHERIEDSVRKIKKILF